jgi:prolyl oligopeptidase
LRTVLLLAASVLTLAACATAPDPAAVPAAEPAEPVAEARLDLSPEAVKARDEFVWLEEVESPRALAWVAEQNARSQAVLEGDPRYARFREEAVAIFTSEARIPVPVFRAGGIDNFWQDKTNPKGLWRRTTLDSYRTDTPRWETLLDVGALARAEGRNWVWKGANCLPPDRRYCLVSLSNGGQDAVEVREFDTRNKVFRADGFRIPEGKHRLTWVDADTLAVATDFGGGTLTESGYPYVVKLLTRGQTLDAATEIFRGSAEDGGYGVFPSTLRDEAGRPLGILIGRPVDTFDAEYHLWAGGRTQRVPLPTKASFQEHVDGQVIFTLEEAWGGFPQGALIAYDLAALTRDAAAAKAELIFAPDASQAIEGVTSTDERLIVHLLENVNGAIDVWDRVDGRWTAKRLALPQNATFSLGSAQHDGEKLFVGVQSFLEPTGLYLADAATGSVEKLKSLPPQFDASRFTVDQFFATSRDGTRVPYFVVRPKDLAYDGTAPTLQFGYGGFQISKPPVYLPEVGKLWLENGGVYVIANIRGGGEFGPAWHQSVLREKRQGAFDDFHAVAEDLIRRKITSPEHLGIYGRSNGGVLTSVAMTQRPDLYEAVVIESPLIDMLRYHEMPAGASWIGEYGDPRVPADAAFIARYSAYQALKPGRDYPEPYVTTNTRDDRVHPGHARKFAARMQALGYPVLYFEDTEGGHSYDSDPIKNAERWARHYVYLSRKLKD